MNKAEKAILIFNKWLEFKEVYETHKITLQWALSKRDTIVAYRMNTNYKHLRDGKDTSTWPKQFEHEDFVELLDILIDFIKMNCEPRKRK